MAVSSDGSPTGYHPRGHGTFAKVIEKMASKLAAEAEARPLLILLDVGDKDTGTCRRDGLFPGRPGSCFGCAFGVTLYPAPV